MPAGTVERDHGMRALHDLRADLLEVQVHRIDIDVRQDESGTDPTCRTNGAEDVGPLVSLIPWPARASALFCPDVSQAALLADPGFILPPELDRFAAGVVGNGGGDQRGEFFCVPPAQPHPARDGAGALKHG